MPQRSRRGRSPQSPAANTSSPTGLLGTRGFRRAFHAGLALKGIDGILEAVGGLVILFTSPARLNDWIAIFTARELSNHPDDWIGRAIVYGSHALAMDTRRFASFYLIAHGIVKLLLVVAVWRERSWAFPIALWFMGFFLLYQLYRIAHTHSIALMVLSALDVFVLWVIWRDRQLLRGASVGPTLLDRLRRVRAGPS